MLQVPVCISLTSVFVGEVENLVLQHMAVVLSVIGTMAVALEDFFQFGARARARRLCMHKLDRTFWEFYALTGPWDKFDDHTPAAFAAFAMRIESCIRESESAHIATFSGVKDGGTGKAEMKGRGNARAHQPGNDDADGLPSAAAGMRHDSL